MLITLPLGKGTRGTTNMKNLFPSLQPAVRSGTAGPSMKNHYHGGVSRRYFTRFIKYPFMVSWTSKSL